jgi:Ala-tRNA(Pro) deacylase
MAVVTPQKVYAHLDRLGIAYRVVQHEPTRTSEESAKARGEPLEIGAKALLLKVDGKFVLTVLSAARRLDSKAVRTVLEADSVRFARPDELLAEVGLVPGSVPPFGHPVQPFELLVDSGIRALQRVAFNAASLTESVVMGASDYLSAAQPRDCFGFSLPIPEPEGSAGAR